MEVFKNIAGIHNEISYTLSIIHGIALEFYQKIIAKGEVISRTRNGAEWPLKTNMINFEGYRLKSSPEKLEVVIDGTYPGLQSIIFVYCTLTLVGEEWKEEITFERSYTIRPDTKDWIRLTFNRDEVNGNCY